MMLQQKKINQRRALIKAILKNIGLYSETAVELVLATGVHEGRNFDFIKQIEGPARSPYQIEPFTHNDNWKNFLYYKPDLAIKILKLAGETLVFEIIQEDQHEEFIKDYIEEERYQNLAETSLLYNEAYSIAHCRIKYYRSEFKMPQYFDIEECAQIWKDYYNSASGKGHTENFIRDYRNFVED